MSPWLSLLCVLCSLGVLVACTRTSPPPPPLVAQVSGTLEVAGLSAPVRVVRDRSGVPHIYAQNPDDLFFAQGLVQAQDRLFQMDLWRRSVQGRLAEVLGGNFVERDAMTRRVQYRGDLDVEWASYGPGTKAIATAFVRGVNAWVSRARERPPEAFVLAGWTPELWAPEDLLNRTDAFVASGDALDEIFRARLVAAVGAGRADALLPVERRTLIPPGLDVTTIGPVVGDAIRRVGTPPFFMGLARTVTSSTVRLKADTTYEVRSVRLQPDRDVRALDHPSRRYLVHLKAPGWNVIGATAPWLPGVAIGHNEDVAWDATPVEADTEDVFVEKVNPSNAHQVEDNRRWVDTTIVKESIGIRGNPKPFEFESEYTRHGVIVAVDRGKHLAFAVRWTGTEPGAAGGLAALALDRATSAPAFKAALAHWKMPAQRFTFAAVTGNSGDSGSQIAGIMPMRRGWNGSLPAPAWSDDNDWTGRRTPDRQSEPTPGSMLARFFRARPDRADAFLQNLVTAAAAPDSLKRQRALVVDALADAMRAGEGSARAVLFAYPLAISEAARRRFNIGPLAPARDAPPFALTFQPAAWDRSTAMNAPGQSESPDSTHFADLAERWAAGETIPLAFSDAAVEANTETTLTLKPAVLRF